MTKILSNKSSIDLDYPICRPSLDLDFTQERLDPRITFTRGSIGTSVNRNRLIETVSANLPRFDYDLVTGECKGLLIEESRTNLVTYSDNFSVLNWTKNNGSISANSISAPDGTTTADAFIENTTANAYHFCAKTITKAASSITYTFSSFAQSKGGRRIGLRLSSGSNGAVSTFNIVSGTITATAGVYGTGFSNASSSITQYPNNWYRISLTVTSDTTTSLSFQFYLDNGTTVVYTGDGTSGIYLWGAQLEAGAFPTSYIPTTASTVTRSDDRASMTGTNFSSWYNQSEGTISFNSSRTAIVSSNIGGVSDGTLNNRINFRHDTSGTTCTTIIVVANSLISFTSANVTSNSVKFINAFKSNELRVAGNGTLGTPIIKTTFPTVNQLSIGNIANASTYNGTISRFTYYPRKLKDNQLLYLTQ